MRHDQRTRPFNNYAELEHPIGARNSRASLAKKGYARKMQKVGSVTHQYLLVCEPTVLAPLIYERCRAMMTRFFASQRGDIGTRPTMKRTGIPPFVVRAAIRSGNPSCRSSA